LSGRKVSCVRCNSLNINLDSDGTYECIDCKKKFRNHNEYSTTVSKSLSGAYRYFSDIKSYDKRYPRYCQRIDIVQESPEEILTTEFWNISLDHSTDHIMLKMRYMFFPMEKICYGIVGDYAQGLKNCLFFEGEEDIPMTIISGSRPPLDIVSLPPANRKSERYIEMLHYFRHQDRIYLENRQLGYIAGQLCPKCKRGQLLPSGQKEATRRDTPERIVKTTNTTIEIFLCEYCGSRFNNTVIDMM
jgi:hypothetical protein